MDRYPDKLWLETPLIRSTHISSLLGVDAYLKLENLQPSQSFKARGVSYFAQHAVQTRGPDVHLVIASSGNAGLAAAWAANLLNVPCTIYLPRGVGQSTMEFMRKQNAKVVVVGDSYPDALRAAQQAVAADTKAVMIPSYDDRLLWEGHASMVHEIHQQLPGELKPAAIFCSVGGGGLAGGIMTGLKTVEWDDVPLVAVETHGSNCFYQSLSLNKGTFVRTVQPRPPCEGTEVEYHSELDVAVARLSKLTSRATSLGASSPSPSVVKMALERKGGVKSLCVSDEMAMQTATSFAEDHKILVELACAATLVPGYNPSLFRKLVPQSERPPTAVVFVVCGVKVTLAEIMGYRELSEREGSASGDWEVSLNGESLRMSKA